MCTALDKKRQISARSSIDLMGADALISQLVHKYCLSITHVNTVFHIIMLLCRILVVCIRKGAFFSNLPFFQKLRNITFLGALKRYSEEYVLLCQ